ncbi:MAG: 4-hydroxyphenylacetate 3-hydroxylase N-terminal domain-containing protein, partial [Thermodesulfobacteriota bacterium]
MPLKTRDEYLESLRRMRKRIFMFGEEIKNFVDHPMIRPSINACAMTYELSHQPEY